MMGKKKNICVTRPRGFGKTVIANMLAAYYSYSESKITIFDGKLISKKEDWDKYLGKFNVIKLNMIDYFLNVNKINEGIKKIQKKIIDECKENGIKFEYEEDKSFNMIDIMDKILKNTGKKIVIIIDEWDIVLRSNYYDDDSQYKYLNFLTSWIKDKHYIVLTYMTGILPIKGNGLNSGLLEEIEEYSMTSPGWVSKYIGFTDNEVKKLCDEYNNRDKVNEKKEKEKNNDEKINYENIKKWYCSYNFIDEEKKVYEIYTPFSIMNVFEQHKIDNYLINSETFYDLSLYINLDLNKLKEDIIVLMKDIRNNKLEVNIRKYQNIIKNFKYKDEALTMLIHLGYLAYDSKIKSVYIPNKEVLMEFKLYTKEKNWNKIVRLMNISKDLLIATWNKKEKEVANLIETFHNLTRNKSNNNEKAMGIALQYAYHYANIYYTLIPEFNSGKGYADLVFMPFRNKHIPIIIEIKYNKSTEKGINQIIERKYNDRLCQYKKILIVSINYNKNPKSKNFKHHECKIEEIIQQTNKKHKYF